MTTVRQDLRRDPHRDPHDDRGWAHLFAARSRAADTAIAKIMALSSATDVVSFSGGFPDPQTFPREHLARIMGELVDAGEVAAFQYAPTAGLPGTRDYLAGRLADREGRRPADAELMVTSGSIEALELVAKSLLDAGDVAVVEAPTYLGAIMAFRSFEARVESIPLDDDGMDVDAFARRLAGGLRPKLVYTVSDHHNPAGVSLSPQRRVALVELARRYGFLVVEDVAYRELSFDGERPASLWSLGPDVVMQAGTLSKVFAPGMRLGWAAAPAEIIAQMVIGKQNTDQCAGALGQRLLEVYGREGLLDAQIRQARRLYGERCRLVLAALERHMPEAVRWTRPRGGFFTWVTLPAHLENSDSVALADDALRHGVAFVPGVPFYADGAGTESFRLSFSRVSDAQIDEGVRRIAELVA